MSKNWIYVALALSVAANILIIGFLIGRGSEPHMRRKGPEMAFSARHLAAALPATARQKLRAMMQERRGELRDTMRKRRQLRDEAAALITAETIDQQALAKLFRNYAALGNQLATIPSDLLLEILPELSTEQRKKLAQNLFERRKFMRKHLHKNAQGLRDKHKKGEE